MAQTSFPHDRIILKKGEPVPGAQVFLPWGDALQIGTVGDIPAGAIWRPNQLLARRSRGNTTHQLYHDVYTLLRAGLHIRDQYGIRHPDESSERGMVTTDIEDARLVVKAILGLRVTTSSDAELSAAINARLAERYTGKLDENKATSGQRFARALHAFDEYLKGSSGHAEPESERKLSRSQAAMVAGSGIHYLQRRLETMESIARWLEFRTGKIYALIGRTMTVYRELWGILARPEFHLRGTERRLELNAFLTGFVSSARTMRFRPFRKNAFRAGQDAQAIQEALILGDDTVALEGMKRLRRGIRWIFMLNAVQCEIAIPLSLALERHARATRLPSGIGDVFSESEQKRLCTSIEGLPGRLHVLSDEGLETAVKADVAASLARAIERATQRKWRPCLAELDSLMDILLAHKKAFPRTSSCGDFSFCRCSAKLVPMSVFVLQGSAPNPNRRINYQAELNQEQLDVVLHGDGPCLVLAGAGSGKTRTVTYRVAYLLEQGIDPSQILLLTFTNKASKEMLQRVNTLLGDETRGLWGGTFHSIGNRILRAFAEELGYTSSFTILDQDDGQSLIKAIMKERKIDPKARRFPTAAVLQNVISYSRNTLKSIDEVLEEKHPSFVEFTGEVGDIARDYANRKQSANAMDFDDLLVNWLRLLQHVTIGEHLRSQFRFLLVDEYQDTNAIQASIVMEMAKAHKNVVVVGDDAQSIYAFRGADVHNILDFPHVFPGTKVFKLLTNYRSVPQILDLANESLLHNTEQFQKDLIAVLPKGSKPSIISCASTRQEAQYVAEQILALRAEGIALANMAVLFRSSAHSQALEFELMKRDIPYEYRGGMKFFERAHIKDAICYIRVIQNTADEAAWLRVLGLQTGIGATTASNITQEIKRASDIQAIITTDMVARLPSRARGGWDGFVEILRGIAGRSPRPSDMLKAVIESTYQEYLEREYPDWKERLEDLEQLVIFAEGYPDPTSFLADIALYDDVIGGRGNQSASADERMVLSTIHQAKGLEWDTVFIVHLADGSFPSRRSQGEQGGIEEERRLFYVAVTRARRRLFLSYPITSGFDTLVLNQPSLFLEEVPAALMERVEIREARSAGFSQLSNPSFGRKSNTSFRGATNDEDRSDWSWDEPTISIDNGGERSFRSPSPSTVWKKKT